VPTPLRVLFIEDSEDDATLQVRLLRQAGYDVAYACVQSAQELKAALKNPWDIVISDYSMLHFSGTEALKVVREKEVDVPFIFVSGTIGEDAAVAALKVGAHDYLMKTNLGRLIPSVQRELRESEERRQRQRLEEQVHQLQRFEAIGRNLSEYVVPEQRDRLTASLARYGARPVLIVPAADEPPPPPEAMAPPEASAPPTPIAPPPQPERD